MSLCLRPLTIDVGILKRPAALNGKARVPCGQCQNCRINQKRILQHRIIMESSTWPHTTHVALTYNDESLPNPPFVNVKTMQVFIRKLRRHVSNKFKYFVVGEYGDSEKGIRPWNPHYHAILFGIHPQLQYEAIRHAWSNGAGTPKCDEDQLQPVPVTPELAAYCAGYVAKKAKTEDNRWLDRDQAWIYRNIPKDYHEFATWSNGMGKNAIIHLKENVDKWQDGFNVVRSKGRKYPLGRYLRNITESEVNYGDSLLRFKLGQEKIFNKNEKRPKPAKYKTDRRAI